MPGIWTASGNEIAELMITDDASCPFPRIAGMSRKLIRDVLLHMHISCEANFSQEGARKEEECQVRISVLHECGRQLLAPCMFCLKAITASHILMI